MSWIQKYTIRNYLRSSRGMLENLIEGLPPQRIPPLLDQLRQLERVAERNFTDPEERTLADIGDYQGIGGSRLRHTRSPGDQKKQKEPDLNQRAILKKEGNEQDPAQTGR
jgi:hypothetical protein